MRIELRDGQWAELRERITHGADKELKRLYRKMRTEPDLAPDFETLLARTFVSSWHVIDPDGAAVPLADADAIDRAPDDVVDAVIPVAWEAWTGIKTPTPTPPSSVA